MELSAETVCNYLDHVFGGMNAVLDRLDDDLVNERPGDWGTNSVAGLIVHCCELTPSWFETPGLGRETVRDRDAEFEAAADVVELRERIELALSRSKSLAVEFDAGPTAENHPFREFLPGGDRSDASLVIHVFEELFQHLGHMEVIADTLAPA